MSAPAGRELLLRGAGWAEARNIRLVGSALRFPRPDVNDRPDAPETIERDDKPRGDPEELTVTARRIDDEVRRRAGRRAQRQRSCAKNWPTVALSGFGT
ncbi:hypothetical protein [Rhodococcus erythropolis]|uniref:hypothetical protein n=1 Tax=Rhodococcus erythropolis TaxID=1833 RepID=UPI00301403FB